jgi:hypothetical protein
LIDGNRYSAGRGIGFLSGMDCISFEAHVVIMPEGM